MTLSGDRRIRLVIAAALIAVAGVHFWIHRPFYWVWMVAAIAFLGSAVAKRPWIGAIVPALIALAGVLLYWVYGPLHWAWIILWVWVVVAIALLGSATTRRLRIGAAIILLVLAFIAIHGKLYNQIGSEYEGFQNFWDSGENLVGAYTIATHGVYSINLQNPQPTTRREPLYSLLLAGLWKIFGVIDGKGVQFSWTGGDVDRLHILNVAIIFGIMVVAGYFVFWQTGRVWLSLATVALLLVDGPLIESAHTLLTEVPAAFVLLLICILLCRALDRTRSAHWTIALSIGVACGVLFFIKAVYLLLIPVAMLALLFAGPPGIKSRLRATLIMGLSATVIILPWFVRNYVVSGNPFPADRSAEMIVVRALYDDMSSDEYRYLFVVWTPGAGKVFLPRDRPSAWQRTIGEGYDGIARDAYERILYPYFGQYEALPNGSYEQSVYLALQKRGMREIAANLSGYLKLSMAFMYRALFIDDGRALRMVGFAMTRDNNGVGEMADCLSCALLINLPRWLMFWFVLGVATMRRDWAIVGFTLPVVFTVVAYSFLAYTTPRYMQPVTPSLVVIFALGISNILGSLQLPSRFKKLE